MFFFAPIALACFVRMGMENFGSLLAQQVQMEGNPIVALITGVVGLFFWLGLYIVMAVALMTIAKKTNTPNEWWAWVPILNVILMLQIAQLEIWYIVLLFIPCVNLFVAIYTWWKIAERRGKPGAIAILMVVPFINFFVPLYIAFSD
ncbi:MAG: hypothetical protein IT363_02100 [Methanoregulaceae archaeon]|nr:hypothetical protein [Methanoregulaceae archaeon]